MIKNKDERKVCKGCKFYEHFVTFSQCPCLTCLVKSMCSRTCEEFFKYRDRVIEFENSILE
jgi:hypothetical protein